MDSFYKRSIHEYLKPENNLPLIQKNKKSKGLLANYSY